MDISFRLFKPGDIDNVSRFLLSRKLNYREYDVWLSKALEELRWGCKDAVLGFNEGNLVSNLIFQDCKHLKNFCELKNARIVEELERRYFLSFMTRQAEVISKQEGKLGMICDARTDRLDVLNAFRMAGYKEVARIDLYGENYEDVVLMKSF